MHEREPVHLDGHPGGDDDRRVQAVTASEARELAKDPRVPPYDKLGEALERAQKAYPDAVSLREVWTPNGEHPVHVEVWRHWNPRAGLSARVLAL